MSLILIDIPDKTIARIRSDYGHGKGNYPLNDEDKKIVNDAIYNGMSLNDVKDSMVDEINKFEIVKVNGVEFILQDSAIDAINDWYPVTKKEE